MTYRKKFLAYKHGLLKQADCLRFPASVLFELTSQCNFRCSMCYIHNIVSEKRQAELSTVQWFDIFDKAIESGLVFATLSGGECLLRPDFKELYLYLYKRGISVRINTNGSLLTDEIVSFFKEYPPEDIQISLYGTSEEEYKAATHTEQFHHVIHAIEQLKDANIIVKLAITPSAESKPFLTNIIKFAIDNQFDFSLSEYLLAPRDETGHKQEGILPSDICSYLKYIKEQKGVRCETIPLSSLPLPGRGGEKIEQTSHCRAGRSLAMIDAKGFMHPCVALADVSASVLENSYFEAWKLICDSMDQRSFPKQCGTCAYKKICRPCYAIRCNTDNSSECNPATCELIRLKCSAGFLKYDLELTNSIDNSQ